ncbi:outer membrane protein TolC [Chitinophaga niastensis]|uniref:Outer membrane protein TolC n=1 Tax=Chitinophaga niastensis TaxID=536980 RepID=A0A2P8HHK5_CHINA|nr:TolC family protein [Chitinophaga niastensis]PSL45712.1 outer membrane protein TolC [Chitinophaga niastensis]
MNVYHKRVLTCACFILLSLSVIAQQRTIHIKELLSLVQSQPQVKAYEQQSQAAQYNVRLAKNSLLPEVTAGYQAGYATYNNIIGISYPGLIAPMTGPPSTGNVYDPVPGTAIAAMVKWNPLTFGQRQASVEKAAAQYKLAGSYYNDALFRQQFLAISTYLDAVYLQKLLLSYQANIERTKAGLQQSLVYAQQGLRPGIDTTQFQSVLAQAQTDLLIVQRQYYAQMAELTRLAGLPDKPNDILLSDTSLINQLPSGADTAAPFTAHPAFQYYQTKKEVSEAALKEIQRAWRPKLDLWANAFARGSGVAADGTVNKADGWSLTRKNYGAGVQLSFPILQFSQVNLQKKQYRLLLKSDEAQLDQVKLNLQKQKETAQFNYDQNLLIAQQALIQSQAARYAFDGLKLSYESGLIDFTRLIQGQYDLLKAETGEAAAFLQTWHALLELAAANGDLKVFTDKLK